MSIFALGKKNWNKFTPSQRVKYTELFVKRLKDSYRGKIQFFEDQEILFKAVVHKKTTIQIPMQMVSEGKKFDVVYKYRQVAKRWKIYDVEIQGVSLILTYRSQINDVLKHGTVDDLMTHLKKVPTP
jgi:phospholipid transport system substrate-binding protein